MEPFNEVSETLGKLVDNINSNPDLQLINDSKTIVIELEYQYPIDKPKKYDCFQLYFDDNRCIYSYLQNCNEFTTFTTKITTTYEILIEILYKKRNFAKEFDEKNIRINGDLRPIFPLMEIFKKFQLDQSTTIQQENNWDINDYRNCLSVR